MRLFFHHLEHAYDSVRSNRIRSLLTMSGVAIGIATITVILALSQGAVDLTNKQTERIGDVAVIRPGTPLNFTDIGALNPKAAYSTSSITNNDLVTIEQTDGVIASAPIVALTGNIHYDKSAARGVIIATTPELENTAALPIKSGQFLDSRSDIHTAVIGHRLSLDLFGTDESVGYVATLKGVKFRVIGVIEKINEPINYSSIDFDRAAFVSMKAGQELGQGSLNIQQVNIQYENKDVLASIEKSLLENHLGEKDFQIATGRDIAAPTNTLLYTITVAALVTAFVALVVGGIGIMNILLVAVAERTREIGLRKALGATSGDIAAQFITESLVISIVGGIGGLIFGYALAFTISLGLTFDPTLSWQVIAIGLGLSVIVGVLFGVLPAIKAARKNPIESLRIYH